MRSPWCWVVVGVGLLLGCSSGEDDDRSAQSYDEGRQALCQGFCAGLYRCGLADHGCTEGCIAEYQPLGFRGSALAAVGACAKLADCETLASDDPTKACFEQAGRAEPLRAELLDYCESASRAYFRCDNWWSIEDCTESMGVFEDDVLARAQMSCHGRDCDALADCETSIFNPEASDQ